MCVMRKSVSHDSIPHKFMIELVFEMLHLLNFGCVMPLPTCNVVGSHLVTPFEPKIPSFLKMDGFILQHIHYGSLETHTLFTHILHYSIIFYWAYKTFSIFSTCTSCKELFYNFQSKLHFHNTRSSCKEAIITLEVLVAPLL